MKPIVFMLTMFSALSAKAASQEFANVQNLEVSVLEGNLEISESATNKAVVTLDKKDFSERCDLRIEQSGNGLSVRVDKSWIAGSIRCEADIRIQVPRETTLTAYKASGKVKISGIQNTASIKTSSAAIAVENVTSPILKITTTAGRVDLNYTEKAPRAVLVSTVSGSAHYVSPFPTAVKFRSLSGGFAGAEKSSTSAQAGQLQFESTSGSLTWK